MKTRVQRWGEQLAICIPKDLAVEKGLSEDALLDLTWVGGHLEVRLSGSKQDDLESLLGRISPDNRHGEWETGSSVGKEEW
jgi:antitoxin MazE